MWKHIFTTGFRQNGAFFINEMQRDNRVSVGLQTLRYDDEMANRANSICSIGLLIDYAAALLIIASILEGSMMGSGSRKSDSSRSFRLSPTMNDLEDDRFPLRFKKSKSDRFKSGFHVDRPLRFKKSKSDLFPFRFRKSKSDRFPFRFKKSKSDLLPLRLKKSKSDLFPFRFRKSKSDRFPFRFKKSKSDLFPLRFKKSKSDLFPLRFKKSKFVRLLRFNGPLELLLRFPLRLRKSKLPCLPPAARPPAPLAAGDRLFGSSLSWSRWLRALSTTCSTFSRIQSTSTSARLLVVRLNKWLWSGA